jgi:hypothetical protein
MENIDYIMGICRKNGWNCDTPNIAGKLETLIKPYGFTKQTRRDYVDAVVDILESKQKYGAEAPTNVQLEGHEKKKSVHREAKRGVKDAENGNPVIYTSPVLPIPFSH